jgi:urease accessory protein
MRSGRRLLPLTFALGALLALPSVAHAHVGVGSTVGFWEGVAHPFSGLDHICAMVGVGLWAAQRGGRAIWLMPIAFVLVMAAGGILGMAHIFIPFVEPGIIASVFVLGLLLAAAIRLPLVASACLVCVFALFHGHAHGAEMPSSVGGLAYGVGFIASTLILHSCGVGLGIATQRTGSGWLTRCAGGAMIACGFALCVWY